MIDKEKSNLKNKKTKKILLVAIIALVVSSILISGSMAYYKRQLESDKKYVITASSVVLVLDETSNDITIDNTLPQTDEDGMTNSAYTFSIENMGSTTYQYTIYLEDNEIEDGATRVSDEFIKYYLTNDSLTTQKDPALLSSLSTDENGRILETGTIAGGTKYNYTLRFWVDYDATQTDAAGKAFSVKLNIIATQKIPPFVERLADKVQDSTDTFPDFSQISSPNNGNGIYKYTEDGEDIYYWRGAVADNHIIFAGYCWEMVRTTKKGGIKIIYDGLPVEVDGKQSCSNTGTDSQLPGTSMFNSEVADNAYIGYMYGLTGVTAEPSSGQCIKLNSAKTQAEIGSESTKEKCITNGGKWATTAYEATHVNVVNSTVKGVIDTWFETSSLNTEENLGKLEDAVFCNDRSIGKGTIIGEGTIDTDLGYGASPTSYKVYNRIAKAKPILECSQENDRFTVSKENGNGDLTYPVGMLTADEMALAGGQNSSNSDYFLYTGEYYLTFSPYMTVTCYNYQTYTDDAVCSIGYVVHNNGKLDMDMINLGSPIGVRPVITLSYDVEITGDGTVLSPYEVS